MDPMRVCACCHFSRALDEFGSIKGSIDEACKSCARFNVMGSTRITEYGRRVEANRKARTAEGNEGETITRQEFEHNVAASKLGGLPVLGFDALKS
jgi:hypothetical protein